MTTATENQITTPADEAAEEAEAAELFAEAAAARRDAGRKARRCRRRGSCRHDADDDEPGTPGEGEGGSADDQPGKIEGAAAEAPASGSGEFDWSNADPAAKAAYEAAKQQFEHKLKSANGRVSVLDRSSTSSAGERFVGWGAGAAAQAAEGASREATVKQVGRNIPTSRA
jgi:hypothetical protein